MLTVYPKEHSGVQIYSDQIMNRMKLLRIPPVREMLINQVIEMASGQPVPLVEWPEGELFSAKIELTVDDQAMTAQLLVHPPKPGGEPVTEAMIQQALEDQEIIFGVDQSMVRRIASEEIYGRSLPIAQGQPPVAGKGARVKHHFITEKKPFKELRYGRIDLKELNFIQDRRAGELLAELIPGNPAVPGSTIKGQTIPAEAPEPDQVLRCGKNVQLEGNKILAGTDGNACLIQGAVTIEPLVVVQNVDYSTGNLDFQGSVVVKGTVADGFKIKASGDIEISKCVGRVELQAGRSLMLRSGVNGDSKALLSSGSDCWSRYIEGASLLCRGNMLVQESIMHSNISVWGNLMLSGGRAELLGGSALVQGTLWCRKLGGLYETPTKVILGVSPKVLQEYSQILRQVEKKRMALDELDRTVKELRGHGKAKTPQGVSIAVLEDKARQVNEEIGALQQKAHGVKRDNPARENSLLVVEERIFGGVHLSFGFLDHPMGTSGERQIILHVRQDKVQQQGFNPSEPPEVEEVETLEIEESKS